MVTKMVTLTEGPPAPKKSRLSPRDRTDFDAAPSFRTVERVALSKKRAHTQSDERFAPSMRHHTPGSLHLRNLAKNPALMWTTASVDSPGSGSATLQSP